MSRALIFGVGGFVGRYLTQELQAHGYTVSGSDLLESCSLPGNAEYYKANILDAEEVRSLVGQLSPDVIVDLAAISSVGASWNIPQMTMAVNVYGSLNVIEAARQLSPMPKILFIGSSEEYEASDEPMNEEQSLNANNPYGISKMAQERFAELYRIKYGMQIYCVRPFNHTGIGQKDTFVLPSFCKQAAEIEKSGQAGVIRVGNLAARRDFSDVRDVVRAYRMILEQGDCSRIYNVGSGKAYSLQELLEYIISLSNQDIQIEVDPERFRPIDTPVICCDAGRIREELGWQPEYSIFDTVRGLYESYLSTL